MEPLTRVVFDFPIYALDLLSGDGIVVAGGGGRMKSGIPNTCQVLTFNEKKTTLTPTAAVQLADAAVALATHESVIHLVIGLGVKDYNFLRGKLVPVSSFHHDLQVSVSEEQTAIAASEDASTLVIASDYGNVVVLGLERFEPIFSGQIHTNGITDLCVLSDGSLVATTGRDKAAHIWRSRDGEILQTLKPIMASSHRTHIRAIRFCSAQSDILFTAESNPRKGGWIAAWRKPSPSETTLYAPIATIRASNDALTAMCVNTDGSLLASSSAEGHVSLFAWNGTILSKLWSTETRTHLFKTPKPPHVLPVTAMRFSESGRHVFAASADYTISVWPTRLAARLSTCSRLLLWLLSTLVLMFAMLVAEDEHLPKEVGRRRAIIAPYMEPHLSEVQRVVRPLLKESHQAMQPQLVVLRQRTNEYISRFSEQGYPILKAIDKVYRILGVEHADDQGSHESLTLEPTVGEFPHSRADVVDVEHADDRRAHLSLTPEPTVGEFPHSDADVVIVENADDRRAHESLAPELTVGEFPHSRADVVDVEHADDRRAHLSLTPEPTAGEFPHSDADVVIVENADERQAHESLAPELTVGEFPHSRADVVDVEHADDRRAHLSLTPEPTVGEFPHSDADVVGVENADDRRAHESLTPEPTVGEFPHSHADVVVENADDRRAHVSLTPEPTVGEFSDSHADVLRRTASCRRKREGKKIILQAYKTKS